jgi:alanyl-tRNA synthetase
MGLERLAAVVQGVRSNYDTDLFQAMIQLIQDLCEKAYGRDHRHDVAFRVIADHARAAAFLIGDGIMPSNEGRGYVLRRIIRRAIRFGQTLGLSESFLHRVCSKTIDVMGEDFPELMRSRSFIEGVVNNEEKRFADTLHYSMRVLEEEIDRLKSTGSRTLPGDLAFKLYDTYGLSLDIVEDVARDENLQVDAAGYEKAMSRQRAQSQESWKGSGEEDIPAGLRSLLARGAATRFVGYDALTSQARVIAVMADGQEMATARPQGLLEIVLDQTPFYGRAGGQVGDTGWIETDEARFRVTDTLKYGQDLIVHRGEVEVGSLSVGESVTARVDEERRKATARNHSSTHLLHASLREVLGDHVKQSGSLVSPDRLRFDFSHFTQISREKLLEIEGLVNRLIRENLPVETTEMSRDEAMATGAVAIFEERYGDRVRLVNTGDGVSMELCGGTHTRRTGDIGLFRIISEGAVAANIRRIEALTGKAALEHDQAQDLELRRSAALLKTSPEHVAERLEHLLAENKEKDREIQTLKSRILTQRSSDFLSMTRDIGWIQVLAMEIEAKSPKELREAADKMRDKLGSGIILLGAKADGRAMLTCVVTRDLLDRFRAGEIIRQVSGIVGGKGGGRPDMAQGGGNKPEALPKALEAVFGLVGEKQG